MASVGLLKHRIGAGAVYYGFIIAEKTTPTRLISLPLEFNADTGNIMFKEFPESKAATHNCPCAKSSPFQRISRTMARPCRRRMLITRIPD
jgi:hypothetical protein